MNEALNTELDYFEKIEPQLIDKGLLGHFVIIHENKLLAEGKDPDEAISRLLADCNNDPPEPLLVRQVLGHRRRRLTMRSPKLSP
jgi:hypothetical protein